MKILYFLFLIVGLAVGFVIGYAYGFSSALDVFVKEASKFVNINEVLIREYLARAGIV